MQIGARQNLTALVLAACLAAIALLSPATARAQFVETAPAPEVSSAEIEVLVQSLQDPEARAKLVAQLKAMQAAQAKAEGVEEEPGLGAMLLATLSENVREASDGLVAVASALLNAPMIVAWAAEQARDPAVRSLWFELIWKIAAILTAAMAIEWAGQPPLRPAAPAAGGPPTGEQLSLALALCAAASAAGTDTDCRVLGHCLWRHVRASARRNHPPRGAGDHQRQSGDQTGYRRRRGRRWRRGRAACASSMSATRPPIIC